MEDRLATLVPSTLFLMASSKSPIVLPSVFDRDPKLKKEVQDFLESLPEEKREEDYIKFIKFINGELTWAEIQGYPKYLLKELARVPYFKFRAGDYRLAESLFKGLSIIDHNNWYYRAALGSVYQKQKMYAEAISEFNVAITLNDREIAPLMGRGECQLHLRNWDAAIADFEAAIVLDPKLQNPWAKRAKVLLDRLKAKQGA